MTPVDFIHGSVFTSCKHLGLTESVCHDQADEAVVKYRRNQYKGKPTDLIKEQLTQAKKLKELGGNK